MYNTYTYKCAAHAIPNEAQRAPGGAHLRPAASLHNHQESTGLGSNPEPLFYGETQPLLVNICSSQTL